MVSLAPPGAKPRTKRTGRTGYACPEPVEAGCAAAGAAAAASAAHRHIKGIRVDMEFSIKA
jgi:hypothetical protein